jgi:hypothetical protein
MTAKSQPSRSPERRAERAAIRRYLAACTEMAFYADADVENEEYEAAITLELSRASSQLAKLAGYRDVDTKLVKMTTTIKPKRGAKLAGDLGDEGAAA